ncbi:MAG TPA: macrolide ABC transporter ATP-binding protein [Clostridiales bacterium]|nr:macrolide ABC transporter ATP-binding protein [Clostridiales bacterium]
MVFKMEGVTKLYAMGRRVTVAALREVDLTIPRGQFLAIMGPSGSGKSTLMHILGCLDRPSSGSYLLEGEDLTTKGDDSLADFRNCRMGFVFQSYNLLPRLDAMENVEVPLVYRGVPGRERRRRAERALARVGLADRLHHLPSELSGGEQQRVAIARSLVGEPSVIFADEPTGNLDTVTGREVIGLFEESWRQGITVVVVTHEEALARYAERVVRLRDGRIVADERTARRGEDQ